MNRHPPQPLDAEERALAALLPRPHGRTEPAPELDARILAAAQAATQPKSAARRPRRSWIGPTAVAASLMLAVGLAWQLRPPPAPAFPAQATDAAAAAPTADAVVARAFEAPPAAPDAQVAQVPAPAIETTPAASPAPPVAVASQASAPAVVADITEVAAPMAAPPPPAPPAPPAAVVAQDASAMPRAMPSSPTPVSAPAMAKAARASETARERITVSGTAAARAEQDEAEKAANAAMLDAVASDDPGEEVPPATANSPEVREAWLRRIAELQQEGRVDEAKASLAEFRRRYPQAKLPPALRTLEPPTTESTPH